MLTASPSNQDRSMVGGSARVAGDPRAGPGASWRALILSLLFERDLATRSSSDPTYPKGFKVTPIPAMSMAAARGVRMSNGVDGAGRGCRRALSLGCSFWPVGINQRCPRWQAPPRCGSGELLGDKTRSGSQAIDNVRSASVEVASASAALRSAGEDAGGAHRPCPRMSDLLHRAPLPATPGPMVWRPPRCGRGGTGRRASLRC